MRKTTVLLLCAAVVSIAGASCASAGSGEPPEIPADISIEVSSDATAPGSTVGVTVTLAARPGIQINRYPKISIKVAAVEGMVAEAEGTVGNDRSPTPEEMESGANYYGATVDPLEFTLALDAGAPSGSHSIPAKLKYYYCVKKSGFCAPKKIEIGIPVTIR